MMHFRHVSATGDAFIRLDLHIDLSLCSLGASKRREHFHLVFGEVFFRHQPRSPRRQPAKGCASFVRLAQQFRLVSFKFTCIACLVHDDAVSRRFFSPARCSAAEVVQDRASCFVKPIFHGCQVSSFFLSVSQAQRNRHVRSELDQSIVQALAEVVVFEVGAVSQSQNRALCTSQEVVRDPFPAQAPPEGSRTRRRVSFSRGGHEEERPCASVGRHGQGTRTFVVQPSCVGVQAVLPQLGSRHLRPSLRRTALGSVEHRHGDAVRLAIAASCVHRRPAAASVALLTCIRWPHHASTNGCTHKDVLLDKRRSTQEAQTCEKDSDASSRSLQHVRASKRAIGIDVVRRTLCLHGNGARWTKVAFVSRSCVQTNIGRGWPHSIRSERSHRLRFSSVHLCSCATRMFTRGLGLVRWFGIGNTTDQIRHLGTHAWSGAEAKAQHACCTMGIFLPPARNHFRPLPTVALTPTWMHVARMEKRSRWI
mmetsp:Transcript_2088/g.13464  ORF Transcript_2088/g.13464 Transcript_2088/m.13464 type:complete len:480 (+) Transcript_2088:2748-4187(+)